MSRDFKQVFESVQASLRSSPDQAVATFTADSQQIDGFRSEAKIRQFSLTVDEPESLAGSDQGPNPVELVLAALGTCQEITYRLYADALGIPLNGVKVSMEGDVDLRGFFAVDNEARPGFLSIRGSVILDSPAGEDDIARLKETVDRHCPVLDLISNRTPVDLSVTAHATAVAAA